MSRAFVKEDVDPPERSGRARSATGLPPGATNYMTVRGAKLLESRLATLDQPQRAALEELLASVTVVQPPDDRNEIAFGAKVTLRSGAGETTTYQIVGVDELDLYDDAVSWISPVGKALLVAEPGKRVTLPSGELAEIVRVEYSTD